MKLPVGTIADTLSRGDATTPDLASQQPKHTVSCDGSLNRQVCAARAAMSDLLSACCIKKPIIHRAVLPD